MIVRSLISGTLHSGTFEAKTFRNLNSQAFTMLAKTIKTMQSVVQNKQSAEGILTIV